MFTLQKLYIFRGKEYLTLPPAAFVANFLGVSITVFAIMVLYLARMPQFKRIPLPEEDKICFELHDNARVI